MIYKISNNMTDRILQKDRINYLNKLDLSAYQSLSNLCDGLDCGIVKVMSNSDVQLRVLFAVVVQHLVRSVGIGSGQSADKGKF